MSPHSKLVMLSRSTFIAALAVGLFLIAAGCGGGGTISGAGAAPTPTPAPTPSTGAPGDHYVETGGFPLAGVYDSANNRYFVTDRFLNEVDVISPVTDSVAARIPIGRPTGIDWMPDGKTLLVGTDSFMLETIDTQKLQITSRIPFAYVDSSGLVSTPRWVHASADGTATVSTEAIVNDQTADFDPWNGAYYVKWNPTSGITPIKAGFFIDGFSGPSAASADGSTVLLTNRLNPPEAAVYDPASGTVTSALGGYAASANFNWGVAVNNDGSNIYVDNESSILRLDHDLNQLAITTKLQLPHFYLPLALSPDQTKLYVPDCCTPTIRILDAKTLDLLGSVSSSIGVKAPYSFFLGQDGRGHMAASVNNGVVLLDLTKALGGSMASSSAESHLDTGDPAPQDTKESRARQFSSRRPVEQSSTLSAPTVTIIPDANAPQQLLWDPVQQHLFAIDYTQIEVFGGNPLALINTIPLPENPNVSAVGISPGGDQLYVVVNPNWNLTGQYKPTLLIYSPTNTSPSATIDLLKLWPDQNVQAVTGVEGGQIAVLGWKINHADLMIIDPSGPTGKVFPTELSVGAFVGKLARDTGGENLLMMEQLIGGCPVQAFAVGTQQMSGVRYTPYNDLAPYSSPAEVGHYFLNGPGPVNVTTFGAIDLTGSDTGRESWLPVSSMLPYNGQGSYAADFIVDPTGALVFASDPSSQYFSLIEVQSARVLQSLSLSIGGPLAVDSAGKRVFGLAQNGLATIQFSRFPLSIGVITPTSGQVGTVVTVSGNGFGSSLAATVDGTAVMPTVIDSHTLQLAMPTHSSGPVQIKLTLPGDEWSAMDAAFVYQ